MKHNFFYHFALNFRVLWNLWAKIRDSIIEFVAVKVLFPIAGVIQKKSKGQLHIAELQRMSTGTFGRELGDHMFRNKIEFIKGFEEHDMKHLLFGFPLSVPGEMRLSAFEFGAGNRSFMTLGVFFPAILLAPDLWNQMIVDYKNGKRNKHIRRFKLKSMLDLKLDLVKEKLNVQLIQA